MDGHDVVIHLASNPDIARAATEPDIDFRQGTALTHNVVEAMRTTSAKRILYASGSGVYGDLGTVEASEDHGPLLPVSTYGASKLAGEALISCYAYMFGLSGCAFRFGNVVGPRQTHGVGFDFVRRLLADPRALRILGDGSQSKSYIHVDRRGARGADRPRRDAAAVPRPSTSRPATTSRSPRSPTWPSSASACARTACASTTPAATAAGRATCRSCASTPAASRASAGAAACRRARRCASRSCRCCRICGRGGCDDGSVDRNGDGDGFAHSVVGRERRGGSLGWGIASAGDVALTPPPCGQLSMTESAYAGR